MVNIGGVDYCYDCEHCAFHEFMELYGFDANPNTCWINCTGPIQKNVDATFDMILQYTARNRETGEVRYFGTNAVDTIGGPHPS